MDTLTDKINQRAYEIYLRRNGRDGNAEDDWKQAEKEILSEQKKETAKKVVTKEARPTPAAAQPKKKKVLARKK